MIALIQRVTEARVVVDRKCIGQIGPGMLALIAVERGDTPDRIGRMAHKLLQFRMFADDSGRMNLNIRQAEGQILLVPQFTLAADTSSGNRPGFSASAPPAEARAGFAALVNAVRSEGQSTATGEFGADMQVALINDGPVTFWLHT